MNGHLFMGKIHVQNRNIVRDSVRKLAYGIPEGKFQHVLIHYRKSILRQTYDNRMINRKIFCKSGPRPLPILGFSCLFRDANDISRISNGMPAPPLQEGFDQLPSNVRTVFFYLRWKLDEELSWRSAFARDLAQKSASLETDVFAQCYALIYDVISNKQRNCVHGHQQSGRCNKQNAQSRHTQPVVRSSKS